MTKKSRRGGAFSMVEGIDELAQGEIHILSEEEILAAGQQPESMEEEAAGELDEMEILTEEEVLAEEEAVSGEELPEVE